MSLGDKELDLLGSYKALHDGLSDMIEGGRLIEANIPDDYQWLVRALIDLVEEGYKVDVELAQENGENIGPTRRREVAR